ncbi:MAG: trypsin-like serine protease [Ruminococcaceae bacterium]|nr:trypsin-like serine protease [Oscillospiraceae bacterium]
MYLYDTFFAVPNEPTDTVGGNTVIYESADSKVPTTVVEAGTVAAVAQAALPSVVEIRTEAVANNSFYGQYVTEGAGSGVVISKDGYIVTNNHVVSGASNITVRLNNGDEHQATLIGTDAQTDVAVIKINAVGLTPAIYGNSENLIIGEITVAIGNPLGELGGTVTDGIISALDREITVEGENMVLLQTNAAVSPGNSGGGLFNAKGELIGIVNAKSSGENIEGLGFAIPINTAKPIISDLIEKGHVTGRPSIGVSVIEITTDYQKYMYKVNEFGVYIQSSVNSEFKTGDRIIAIDGNTVSTFAEIKAIIKQHKVGDKITVTVSRQNKIIDVNITLIDSAENTSNAQ